jgi:maleylacetoacetate isomerase
MEAHVLELVYTIACDTHPLQNLRVLHTYPEGDRPEHAKRIISSGLATFELLLGEQSGKCSVGDEVTWADIVLVPQVYNAQRWGVQIEQFPKISKIYGHLVTLPAFMAAHADNQPDAPKQ